MRKSWLFLLDLDGGSPYNLPAEAFVLHNRRGHIFSHISSFVDSSLYNTKFLYVHGSIALQEALGCFSSFTGSLILWLSCQTSSNLRQNISGDILSSSHGSHTNPTQVKHITSIGQNLLGLDFSSKGEFAIPLIFGKISSFTMRHLQREVEKLQSLPFLSLAAALVPPFGSLSSNAIAFPVDHTDKRMHGCSDQRPCEVEQQGCDSLGLSLPDLNWKRHAVEPKTGIEFPLMLDNIVASKNYSNLNSGVLVGTGSRTMKIIKIKSLKVYAFGFYVHPDTVCKKLGPKYSSVPMDELNKCQDFYQDLLREDIDMTVRLVVNYSGMKISTVKDAFEKSLRARLLKTNPDTDYQCLSKFGSYFTKDIPIPVGTTIDFRRTADGQLITKIGDSEIGAVRSKDLCRAFFDMYIGDVPVSEQTKEEIGKNVANIIRRC